MKSDFFNPLSDSEQSRFRIRCRDLVGPFGLPRQCVLKRTKPSFSLWVAPNPGLLSRTLDPQRLCTSMEELLTSLFSDPDFPPPTLGGNLLVKLGSLWASVGEDVVVSQIEIILNYSPSAAKGLL